MHPTKSLANPNLTRFTGRLFDEWVKIVDDFQEGRPVKGEIVGIYDGNYNRCGKKEHILYFSVSINNTFAGILPVPEIHKDRALDIDISVFAGKQFTFKITKIRSYKKYSRLVLKVV